MEEFVKFVKENGYDLHEVLSITIEESEKGYEDHEMIHNSDNESCDQVVYVDPSRMPTISSQQRTRHRKKESICTVTTRCRLNKSELQMVLKLATIASSDFSYPSAGPTQYPRPLKQWL